MSSSNIALVNIILSVVLTLMISSGVYHVLWNIAPANRNEKNFLFSYSVTWTGVGIIGMVNIFLLWFEVSTLNRWCQYKKSCQEYAAGTKFAWLTWMGIYMVISFFVLLVRFIKGKIQYRDIFIPEWRAFVVSNPFLGMFILIIACFYKLLLSPILRVRQIQKLCKHIQETLCYIFCFPQLKTLLLKILCFWGMYILSMMVFVFTSIVSFSIIPVLLQAFLFPFRIIAGYSFIFAASVVYSFSAFMATFLWKEKPTPTTGRLLLYLSSSMIALLFITIMFTPFASLYQLIVSGSLSGNPILLVGISVLPSLLLSSPLVWLFKSKLLPRFLDIDDEDEEETGSDEEKGKKKVDAEGAAGIGGSPAAAKVELECV